MKTPRNGVRRGTVVRRPWKSVIETDGPFWPSILTTCRADARTARLRTLVPHQVPRLLPGLIPDGPDIARDCRQIGVRQSGASHGWHQAGVRFWLRDTGPNHIRNGCQGSIAPDTRAADKVRANRRTFAVRAMAAGACAARCLTMEDLIAKYQLIA